MMLVLLGLTGGAFAADLGDLAVSASQLKKVFTALIFQVGKWISLQENLFSRRVKRI